jgi:AP-2 complex subunit beta-1
VVPGPGPIEPQSQLPQVSGVDTSKPEPPLPTDATNSDLLDVDDSSTNVGDSSVHEDDVEGELQTGNAATASLDPYASLDTAFGAYSADEPRPMASIRGPASRHDEDDLLF